MIGRKHSRMLSCLAILIALIMVAGTLAGLASSGVSAKGDSTQNFSEAKAQDKAATEKPVPHSSQAGTWKAAEEAGAAPLLYGGPGDTYEVGARASILLSDWGKWFYNETDSSSYMTFVKKAESNHSEVWVADDLSFMPGDERNLLSSQINVTDEDVDYLVHEFEENIYPTLTGFVGPAPPRDGENSVPKSMGLPYFGTNSSGRVMIIIFNIVDSVFFYPWGHGGILGMYNPPTTDYYDRNILFLDSWDWTNRTGAQDDSVLDHFSFGYEGTLAHEYEHLLGDYANREQVAFLSEGSSILAQVLCGYPIDKEMVRAFMATPDNSLIEWSDQSSLNEMADYGAAALFMIYLYDHFGLSMVHNLVVTDLVGVDSVDAAFKAIGLSDWDMNRAFNSWRLANLIRSDTPGKGFYNYKSIDINDPKYGELSLLNWMPSKDPVVNSAADYFGRTYIPEYEYFLPTAKSGAYGTEYIHVIGSNGDNWAEGLDASELKFGLSGQSNVYQGWQIVDQPIGIVDQVFSEDFNHGGAMPGWATESLGVTQHPWYMASSGGEDYFAVANADEMGWDTVDMHELLYMTEGFSTVGRTELGLKLNLDFQKVYWWDVAKILFSVDGGLTWEQLTNYTEDTNELGPSPLSINSEVYLDFSRACGKEDVRLAFEYFTTSWGWWFAVDNIQVGTMVKEKMWWSDSRDYQDYSLYANLNLSGLDSAVLSFDTKWTIENGYDFGFLQVSSDDGASWTSVGNEYTTDQPLDWADTNIIQYLPGITGTSPFDGMGQVSYDLSPWADQEIQVRIRMMTDWALSYEGWFIDNVCLNGELIDDASTHHALVSDIPPVDIDWLVTIYLPGCIGTDGTRYLPLIMTLHASEFGDQFQRHLSIFAVYQDMYLLVSPTAGPCDYGFWIDIIPNGGLG
jgi:hypothetical protein